MLGAPGLKYISCHKHSKPKSLIELAPCFAGNGKYRKELSVIYAESEKYCINSLMTEKLIGHCLRKNPLY